MPMGQLDQLDRRQIRPQPFGVLLPGVFLRAGIKEDCMLRISLGCRLSDISVDQLDDERSMFSSYHEDRQAMRRAADVVHPHLFACTAAIR